MTVVLPVFGVNHADRLKGIIAAKPHRITGAVITIEKKEVNVNSVYANVMTAYRSVLRNMRESGFLSSTQEEGNVLDDFTLIGFPAQIPNMGSIDAIDLVVGIEDGMLVTEIFFQYKGATAMLYTTQVHTANTIKSTLPSAFNQLPR